MDAATVIREYLLLGLRFDRVEEGYVDSFTGDPALRRAVESEPAPDPADLARQAERLLAEVPRAGRPRRRRAPTTSAAHLRALACAGRKFAGQDVGFVDEVRGLLRRRHRQGRPGAVPRGAPQARRGARRQRTARRADAGLPRRRGDPARAARGSHPRVLQRAARPGARRVPAARRRDHQLRGRHRQAVVGVQLLPRRLHAPPSPSTPTSSSRCPTCRGWSPTSPIPGHHTEHCRKEAGLVEGKGRPSRRSSWSTPRSA